MRRTSVIAGAWSLALLGITTGALRAEQFFASTVVSYSPGPGVTAGTGFGVTSRVLGGPRGAGLTAGSLDVLTLGVQGQVTLGFMSGAVSRRIVNRPGPDFIVFENALYAGGNPAASFAELAFVEVSSDGVTFARFPTHSTNPGPIGFGGTLNPANVSGLAGAHPVPANVDANTINPFDPIEAGGDAFDLDSLATHPAVMSGQVRLSDIRYVRIADLLGDGATPDSDGNPIYDPTGLNNSCDIDAVSVIHGCTVGDVNGDGGVTSTDAVALAAALLNPATAGACTDVNGDGAVDGEDISALTTLVVN